MVTKKLIEEVARATGGVKINSKIFKNFYLPLVQHYIRDKKNKKIKTYIIGIQGCQGVGKTVLTAFLKSYLKSAGYRVAGFSIDDFYKSAPERKKLSQSHKGNPFYEISRGLPGTHKYNKLYSALKKAKQGKYFTIPHFDKSLNGGDGEIIDRTASINRRQDFIILEGWCVNIPYINPKNFPLILSNNKYADKIFKELEAKRGHYETVFNYIKKYQKIWNLLDNKTVMLSKNIKWIEDWRIEQEERMITQNSCGMVKDKIREFVRPYIPFTYLSYNKIKKDKGDVDCVLIIKKNHQPEKLEFCS